MSHDPHSHDPAPTPAGDRSDWNKPLPELIPPPTYAPALMAAGIVLLFWGPVTIWIVSVAGVGFIIGSLIIWIKAIRKDWNIKK